MTFCKKDHDIPTGKVYNAEISTDSLIVNGDHEYVDLGLPSGTLWATCNVGANTPEDYGDYFAWGETQSKETYDWNTYKYCMGSDSTLTKYCFNASYGYNGYTDDLITLQLSDDAATANWGGDWRMPTYDEWHELCQNTTHVWTTQNGVNGRLFTSTNGNSIFLPAAGYRVRTSLYGAGTESEYWSSSLSTDGPFGAWLIHFGSGFCLLPYSDRSTGRSVRPVRSDQGYPVSYTISVSANPSNGGSVIGGGTYQQGQNCTIEALADEGYVFTNWTENDIVVSTDLSYTFVVNNNRFLIANFELSYIPSQSIQFEWNGHVYQNGETITCSNYENDFGEFIQYMQIRNKTSQSKSIQVEKELVQNLDGVYNYFCWDFCYSPDTFVSQPVSIGANSLNSGELSFHVFYNEGVSGMAVIKYYAYDMNYPEERISIVVCYNKERL